MSQLKTALITGSSRGIGAGIAQYLLNKGFLVYVTYHQNKEAAEEIFGQEENARMVQLDVTDETSVKQVFSEIKQHSEQLDLLVNNAAFEIPGTTEELSLSDWRKLIDVKLTGAFLCTKYALPLLKKCQRSTIVNITSALSHKGTPRYPAHAAAEAGLISYSKTCAVDLAHYGIRTHMVNPTTTRTDMWKDIGGYDDNKLWQSFADKNPLGRVTTPKDVGRAVYLLTLPEAEYLNGNELYINGGVHWV